MNNSTVSTSPSPVFVLDTELWILYITFYVILDLVAMVLNALVIVLIAVERKLKTFFFALIAGHCFGLFLYALQHFILGIFRPIAYFRQEMFWIPRIQCHTMHIISLYCGSLTSITMCLLAADRLYSIGKPLQYKKRSFKQGTFISLTIIGFILVVKVFPSYSGDAPFSKPVFCTSGIAAFASDIWGYNYGSNIFLMVLSICMYMVLFLFAYFNKRAVQKSGQSSLSDQQTKRQEKILRVISLIIIVYCITVVPFNVMVIMSGYMPSVASHLIVYATSFNIMDFLLDPIVLFTQSSELRQAFKSVFKRSSPAELTATSVNTIKVSPL